MVQPRLNRTAIVGTGLTSEVYEWSPGRVLKLSQEWRPREKAELELKITQAVWKTGLPIPNAFELIEVEGRVGIVFERITGPSVFKAAEGRPLPLIAAARQLADLHAKLHEHTAPLELPPQREQIERWISEAKDLSDSQIFAARRCIEELPAGDTLCHGDFHPDNILMSPRGPIIIDWSTATCGNPVADVARTSSLFDWGELPVRTPWPQRTLFHLSRRLVQQLYLHRYLQIRGGTLAEIRAWLPAQKAARSAWRTSRIN